MKGVDTMDSSTTAGMDTRARRRQIQQRMKDILVWLHYLQARTTDKQGEAGARFSPIAAADWTAPRRQRLLKEYWTLRRQLKAMDATDHQLKKGATV